MTFQNLSLTELCREARIVQLATMLARTPELTVLREAAHSRMKSCMEALVHTYDCTEEVRRIEPWCVKTAGDLLQCWWVHWLLLDSSQFFCLQHLPGGVRALALPQADLQADHQADLQTSTPRRTSARQPRSTCRDTWRTSTCACWRTYTSCGPKATSFRGVSTLAACHATRRR